MDTKHTHRRLAHFVLLLAACIGLIALSHVAGTILAVCLLVVYGVVELGIHLYHKEQRHHAEHKASKSQL